MSIITHIVDVAFDIHLAYRYYQGGEYEYFALTALFILFPALVNTIVSTRMYIKDEDSISVAKMLSTKWCIRVIILIFQLAPILRYCESLGYALKSRQAEKEGKYVEQRTYYDLMLKEDSDVALLRVFECFLEAAPQQVLQTTILLRERGQPWSFQYFSQLGSVASSLCSMGWSMASYHRSIRFAQQNKSNMNKRGTVAQFLWHFMVTVSRILSISVAASLFAQWTVLACVIHWFVMAMWLKLTTRLTFCVDQTDSVFTRHIGELLFGTILALVYIFTYITPQQGHTRNRYLFYYTLCFVENICAAVLWATAETNNLRDVWYFYPLLVSCIVPFIIGIGFMILYYQCFHPANTRNHKSYPQQEIAVQTETDL
ncbi:hypothetical protein R5R35_003637 [Gryllus longicercus]